MLKELEMINIRPEPFEFYTASELWTNEHTSQRMLTFLLLFFSVSIVDLRPHSLFTNLVSVSINSGEGHLMRRTSSKLTGTLSDSIALRK